MRVERFIELLDTDFFVGVPDSQLKAVSGYLMDTYGVDNRHHIIAANEGNATAIAAGYYLANNKPPVVYLQNSGEGNIVNPVASLTHKKVYGIPIIFIVGWRGEPGVHDEPQHIYQGEITEVLLKDLEIDHFVLNKDTDSDELERAIQSAKKVLEQNGSFAFVVCKDALEYAQKTVYSNACSISRENALKQIVLHSGDDPIISTTGKLSRELFEIREGDDGDHSRDFLTVGSMGHASSIALGVAISKPDRNIWCLDGDGAVLMHMGALPLVASVGINNFIHIVMNNGAHESVGGMPTVASDFSIAEVAKACGYKYAVCLSEYDDLERELGKIKDQPGPKMIEIKCNIASRSDLGRPTTTTTENKAAFMKHIE